MIQSVSPRQFRQKFDRYQNFNCIGPGRDLLDAVKENDAAIGKLRGGLSTLQIECAKRGLHWLHVLRQIKLELIVRNKLGITLDYSKGNGGKPGESAGKESQTNAAAALLDVLGFAD